MKRMWDEAELTQHVKNNIKASDIKTNNAQSVQQNLERIDGEINRVEAKIKDSKLYRHKIELVSETSEIDFELWIVTNYDSQFTDVADLAATMGGYNDSNKQLVSVINKGDSYYYLGINTSDEYLLLDIENSAYISEAMKYILSDTVTEIKL